MGIYGEYRSVDNFKRVLRRSVNNTLVNIASRVTSELKNYIEGSLYSRPESYYYNRLGEQGGFLGSFITERNVIRRMNLVFEDSDNMAIDPVIYNPQNMISGSDGNWNFPHHGSMFIGANAPEDSRDNMYDYIDKGYSVLGTSRYIEGIDMTSKIREIIDRLYSKIFTEEMAKQGYSITEANEAGTGYRLTVGSGYST